MNYRFFGIKPFIREFMTTRILLLSGHKGTGKTLLSVALGYELLRLRYVSNAAFNLPVCFAGAPTKNQTYGAIDEAGVIFDQRTAYKNKEASEFITEATTYLRKTGSFLAVPTYTPPDKRLRGGLRMWRIMAFPFYWLFMWELGPEDIAERTKQNYKTGRVGLFLPSYFYGSYDTYYIPPFPLTMRWLKSFLHDVQPLPFYADY